MRVITSIKNFYKGAYAPNLLIFIFFLLLIIFPLKLLSQNKLNLNTATLDELKSLPGVGEVTARNIIEYREKNGGFKNLEELKKVKGIGEKKFELLKNYLTLEGEGQTPLKNEASSFNETYKERSIYYYVDEKGIVHYTQFPETVPPKYRKTLKPLK